MPELPEVERAVRQLRAVMEGARFERVLVRRRRLRTLLPARFAARLERSAVTTLQRRGKYLVATLSSGGTLVMHLGMSGSFDIHAERPVALSRHDHVVFFMSNGTTVVFNDPRRFGAMWLFDEAAAHDSPTRRLGPEPLDDEFVAEVLAEKLRGRRAPLKTVLSDQRVVAGLGNIYVSEALHRARLSPLRASRTLVTPSGAPRTPLRVLVHSIRQILNEAIVDEADEYRFLRVYDREGRRCARRGCRGVIRRIVQAGRSTFYCPVCQK